MTPLQKVLEELSSTPGRTYTEYDLSKIIFYAHVAGKKPTPKPISIHKIIDALLLDGILTEKQYPGGCVYHLTGAEFSEPLDIICDVDMFCYISHWSAMVFHNLDGCGSPDALYITNPGPTCWRQCAYNKIADDFGEYSEEFYNKGYSRPRKISPNKIIRTQVINTYTSDYEGAWVKEGNLRVASIARTFLDMVRCPSRCGGISLVMEVFQKNAHRFVKEIVKELNHNGKKIERVRAGYLMDEVCGIHEVDINDWLKDAQRGGSRKLDPNAAYQSVYSEKWALSINI